MVAQAVLLHAAGVPLLSRAALEETFPIVPLAVLAGAVVGALIVGRHPRHRVGWLFCVGQAGASVGLAAQSLERGVLAGVLPGSERLGQVAGAAGHLLGAPYALALLGLLLLLVPHGDLPSGRWRPVAGLLVAGYALTSVASLLVPGGSTGAGTAPDAVVGLVTTGQLVIAAGLVGSCTALVLRLRRARGEERQQLRWVGAAAVALAGGLVVLLGDAAVAGSGGSPRWYLQLPLYVGYLAVPVATGFAVLRHRLYDIDVIIGGSVRLAALALFVTGGYVVVVVSLSAVLGGPDRGVWRSLAAYVVVALAFQPLRRRVDRLADRVVHGRQAAPYEGLAELSRQLAAGALPERQLLRLVGRCSALAVGATAARATLSSPGQELSEDWPRGGRAPSTVTVPVVLRGRALGRVELALPPGRALSRAQRRLLGELAGQAAVAFHNVRLASDLRRRAEDVSRQREELAESRRRLARAADQERQRVADAIAAEVTVHLVPLPAALADLEREVTSDPGTVRRRLERLQRAVTAAVDALRTITAGMLPAVLARRGLVAAVQAHAARLPRGCRLLVGPGAAEARLGPSVELAAYEVCVRVLDDLPAGTSVGLDVDGDGLLVTVHAQGAEPDWTLPVRDRVEGVGGQLEMTGGVLRVRLPLTEPPGSGEPLRPDPRLADAGHGTAPSR